MESCSIFSCAICLYSLLSDSGIIYIPSWYFCTKSANFFLSSLFLNLSENVWLNSFQSSDLFFSRIHFTTEHIFVFFVFVVAVVIYLLQVLNPMFSAVYFFSITAHSNLKFPVCSLFSLMLLIMFIKIIFLSRPLNPFSPCVFIMFVF